MIIKVSISNKDAELIKWKHNLDTRSEVECEVQAIIDRAINEYYT